MSRPDAPPPIRWITRTLEDQGFETWAVGGAVRDALQGNPSADWDLATRARPEQVQRLFPRTVPVGIDHGTVGILDRQGTLHEITTFRRDVETTGRHAVVSYSDSLVEDLARRDFTINAVAWHPLREEWADPYGGRQDLADGLLRTVGRPDLRFAEDYLRVLRALRFAGRFRLRIDPGTWRALVEAVPGMGRLSAERIREELEKVLGSVEPPSRALSLYAASGALAFLYPELEALVGLEPAAPEGSSPGKQALHASGDGVAVDLWTRSLAAADLAPLNHPELRFAALLHEVGRPQLDAAEGDSSPAGAGSELAAREDRDSGVPAGMVERAEWRVAGLLTRLRSSRARTRSVSAWVGGVADVPAPDAPAALLRGWLSRLGRDQAPGAIRLIAIVGRARGAVTSSAIGSGVRTGGGPSAADMARLVRRLRSELRADTPLEESDLAIDGRDLIRMGYRPGPEFGQVFRSLLELVIVDPAANVRDLLADRAAQMLDSMAVRGGGGRDE